MTGEEREAKAAARIDRPALVSALARLLKAPPPSWLVEDAAKNLVTSGSYGVLMAEASRFGPRRGRLLLGSITLRDVREDS